MSYFPLYANYLELGTPREDGFTPVKCPFHEDKNKSAGINLKNGVFNCLACGAKYSAAMFIHRFTDVSIQEAGVIVDNFRQNNGIQQNHDNFSKKFIFQLEDPKWRELYLESKRCRLEETFATEYCQERGISLDTLKQFDVGFLPAKKTPEKWDRDSLTFPYFYGGKIIGLRFRSENGSKSGLDKSVPVPWGIDNLTSEDKVVIVTEGESDRMRLWHEANSRGLNWKIISTPGSYFKPEWERDLIDAETLIIIPDTDDAGNKMIKQWEEAFPTKVVRYKLNWHCRQLGKDLCEWCAQNDVKELISDLLTVIQARRPKRGILTTTNFIEPRSAEEGFHEELIKGFLYQGQIGIIGGPQKAKKTWLALNLVKTLLTPQDMFLGIPQLVSTDILPNVLYIQTEGSMQKFAERVKKVMAHCKYPDRAHWWFKPGLKLDNEQDVERLSRKIEELGVSKLILDPFQRLHSKNEDSATETGPVWEALFGLNIQFPQLTTTILHHFGKNGSINDRWGALRGSSRMGGEVDFAIFMENRNGNEGEGNKIIFECRDEEKLETPDGKDIFKTLFDGETGLIQLDYATILPSKVKNLEEETEKRKEWTFQDALTFFGVSQPTLKKWIKESTKLYTTPPAPGHHVVIRWIEKK